MTVIIKRINGNIFLVNEKLTGGSWKTSEALLLTNMKEIKEWANNELHEDCLFAIE